MTPGVSISGDQSLLQVMEGLAAHKFGALLITGEDGRPAGVISKTDLIVAYKHRLPPETPARDVMTKPVQACGQDDILARAEDDLFRYSPPLCYRESPAHRGRLLPVRRHPLPLRNLPGLRQQPHRGVSFVGEGGSHGLEARATGASGPYGQHISNQ